MKLDKENFVADKESLAKGSIVISALIALITLSGLLIFNIHFFYQLVPFVFILSYAIIQTKRYRKWIKNELFLRTISKHDLARLIKEVNPVEERFSSNRSISLFVVSGAFLLVIGWHFKIRNTELHENGVIALGKVVEMNTYKNNSSALVEFYVNGKRFETKKEIYASKYHNRYYYFANVDTPVVKIGDEVKVLYLIEDPENNLVPDGGPLNR